MSKDSINRRTFLAQTAAAASALAAVSQSAAAAEESEEFQSTWNHMPDRVWAGAECWTNPLQDWRIRNGHLECIKAAPGRNVHVLTRELAERDGSLMMRVRLGTLEGKSLADARGSAGFAIGLQGPLKEYRNNLIFGSGLNVGLRADGTIFIGDGPNGKSAKVKLSGESVELRLGAVAEGMKYRVHFSVHDSATERVLGKVERDGVPAEYLVGNLALVANYGAAQPARAGRRANQKPQQQSAGAGRWWFADWRISGSKVDAHDERAFGPILFSQYTLHDGTLKMTAQMPPLGELDNQKVRLEVRSGDEWEVIGEESMDALSRTATFRVEKLNGQRDTPYRVAYSLVDTEGGSNVHYWAGTVRRDPLDAEVLTVADISCNAHYAFPNTQCAAQFAQLNPDLVAFTGDQYYESSGGFGVDRSGVEMSALDMLRKWYMHGWTWRELLRDRPSVSIPDDHDVYHGNLWGEGGAAARGEGAPAESGGGYKMMADFVNAVHRCQTAHHPDSPAPAGKQGITGYYGPLTYGRVSFAILADRQYKSGPAGKVPATSSGRADHVNDPEFDPSTADAAGLELLGDGQMKFLRAWTEDWRGADMKAAISQTIFTAMATHHGQTGNHLVADYDTNAWPQAGRNAAVRELRKAFAFHLAGDQHLPAVVHYGIEEHRDAVVAFASPAVNNLYARWFRPKQIDEQRPDGAPEYTGNFGDSFGHPLTVIACANPKLEFRRGVLEAETDKAAGFGVVRFNKAKRTITIECWPLLADVSQPNSQFSGWPVTVKQSDNYSRTAAAHLPELKIRGSDKPVVQVADLSSGEVLYTLRLASNSWRPFTFAEGPHSIVISDPEHGLRTELKSIQAVKDNNETLEVELI